MVDLTRPRFKVTGYNDGIPGPEGNEGWYSTEAIPGVFTLFVAGAWWGDTPEAPEGGWGDLYAIFRVRRVHTAFGKVHRGFYMYSERLIETLTVQNILPQDKSTPIFFLGHSLGAGVSAIVAMMLDAMGYNVKPLFFSCPPVGDRKFKREFDIRFPNARSHYVGNDWVRIIKNLVGWFYPAMGKAVNYDDVKYDSIKHWFQSLNGNHLFPRCGIGAVSLEAEWEIANR